MRLISHEELHSEWMQDDEYRAVWYEEERQDKRNEPLTDEVEQ